MHRLEAAGGYPTIRLQPSDFKRFARRFLVKPGSKVNIAKDFDPRDTHGYDKPENAS